MRLDLNWLEFPSPSPRLEILNQRAANLTLFIKCHAAITKLHQRGCRRKKNNDSSEIVILQLAKWILMLNWLLKEGKERERKKKTRSKKKMGEMALNLHHKWSETAWWLLWNCWRIAKRGNSMKHPHTPTHTHTHTRTHTHIHTHSRLRYLLRSIEGRPINIYDAFNYSILWIFIGRFGWSAASYFRAVDFISVRAVFITLF